ncbi:MAG: DUF262 domain-containing protein, partial [Lachnospiraceae bacterium]|nr:DUF262 domain-containing protein [Lachnospiraceae bacterium]
KTITFWNFLKENTIEIPIIQRDYAQGRLGKENLRKNFLADLKNALDSNETMKLDFVYGSIEKDYLNPLDGQQRLTTLWLLHWYVALRAGELNNDNCAILKKFTYETRISSREFCEKLCEPENFEKFKGNDIVIVGFITKQTWFYSAWKQDPTIQSMLRMLGGTKIADKRGEDIIDGIEESFQKTNEDGFKSYWKKLTQKEVIVFYHLPMKDFGLSDDLYIKMNARGKQLTSFENFKADLIGYVTKQGEAEWESLLNAENGIPIKLDTDWTDIFWKNKSQDSKIDEIYFAFINRYFLQELICAKKEDNTDLYSANELEENNSTFNYLYGNKSNDSQLQYSGLDKYLFTKETEEKSIPLSFFKSFRNLLNNFYKSAKNCNLNNYFPEWVDSKFEFIPKYDEAGNITTLGQRERVVFLAVCRYFEKGDFDETSFRQWMRAVWNIVENSGIETIPALIGAMRLIDELSEGADDIYNFLSNSHPQVKSNFAKDQVAEEIAKAKQILNGKTRPDGKTWEEIIVEAEKYAFFKGAIRFLFTKEVIGDDWCDFDTKWVNAQKYFDEEGVKDGKENDKLYKSNAILMKSLLANCDDFEHKIKKHFEFSNDYVRWRRILIADHWRRAVDTIMSKEVTTETTKDYVNNTKDVFIKNIIDDGLMDYVCNNMSGAWIRSTYHGYHAIWISGYPASQVVLNPILSKLQFEGIISYRNTEGRDSTIPNCRYYRCFYKNVDFKYKFNDKYYYFNWWGTPNKTELDVYLTEDNWNDYKKRPNPTSDKGTDEDIYYCFRVTEDMENNTSLFIEGLKELIEQSQKS